MCGIGGFQVFQTETSSGFLDTVLRCQNSRGSDSQGKFVSPNNLTGLCHNRLAILDLSAAGAQPMHSADGKLTIVYNGEIYNWQELRQELQQYGHKFHTGTDTEVILVAYQTWGHHCLERFNGMFAFALYDSGKDELFLARDRIGKKPLVYAETKDGIFFASELPAVQQFLKLGKNDLNTNALITSLVHNLRHIPEPHTAYTAIKKLHPGHGMIIRSGRIQNIWRYYDPLKPWEGKVNPESLRDLLEDSVERRMVADVPVASLLSGGVDSSAITALMQKHSDYPIKTYALGLNAEDEDLRRARVMADRLGTVHREFYFDPTRQWQVMGDLLRQYGEPIALLPLVHAAELFRHIHEDGSRVVLMGHGADELFYGYTGHWRTLMVSLALQSDLPGLGKLLPDSFGILSRAKPGLRKAALYTHHAAQLADEILTPDATQSFRQTATAQMQFWSENFAGKDYLDESNFIGLMVENQHSITIAGDLPAMQHSVESRCPFLDYRIMQFAWQTPWYKKLVPGKYHQQKYILRRAVADLVPQDLLNAPKRGFGFGIGMVKLMTDYWRAHSEAILLSDHGNAVLGLDSQKIGKLWDKTIAGDNHAASLAFKILIMKKWLLEQVNG